VVKEVVKKPKIVEAKIEYHYSCPYCKRKSMRSLKYAQFKQSTDENGHSVFTTTTKWCEFCCQSFVVRRGSNE
jgi:hypothetical protein